MCIATGWIDPAMGAISLRKNATRPEHVIRVDDPAARFRHGIGVHVDLVLDGDRAKIRSATASGTGRLFDTGAGAVLGEVQLRHLPDGVGEFDGDGGVMVDQGPGRMLVGVEDRRGGQSARWIRSR